MTDKIEMPALPPERSHINTTLGRVPLFDGPQVHAYARQYAAGLEVRVKALDQELTAVTQAWHNDRNHQTGDLKL